MSTGGCIASVQHPRGKYFLFRSRVIIQCDLAAFDETTEAIPPAQSERRRQGAEEFGAEAMICELAAHRDRLASPANPPIFRSSATSSERCSTPAIHLWSQATVRRRGSPAHPDDVLKSLRRAGGRAKIVSLPARTPPCLLGPRIAGTFHLKAKGCGQRNAPSLERPKHFAASWRRKTSRGRNWRKHKMSARARSIHICRNV